MIFPFLPIFPHHWLDPPVVADVHYMLAQIKRHWAAMEVK